MHIQIHRGAILEIQFSMIRFRQESDSYTTFTQRIFKIFVRIGSYERELSIRAKIIELRKV